MGVYVYAQNQMVEGLQSQRALNGSLCNNFGITTGAPFLGMTEGPLQTAALLKAGSTGWSQCWGGWCRGQSTW